MTKCYGFQDLSGLESDKYRIEVDEDGCSGWIVPKEETEETRGDKYLEHHKYLSTHTFYKEGNTYQYYTKLLRSFGFNVELVGY